jgi:hypothetical protein
MAKVDILAVDRDADSRRNRLVSIGWWGCPCRELDHHGGNFGSPKASNRGEPNFGSIGPEARLQVKGTDRRLKQGAVGQPKAQRDRERSNT